MNGTEVEELSAIVHYSRAKIVGKRMVLKLKEMIPRQLIQIAIQAAVGSRVVARETLKPFRKDVTAKLVRICFILIFLNSYFYSFH